MGIKKSLGRLQNSKALPDSTQNLIAGDAGLLIGPVCTKSGNVVFFYAAISSLSVPNSGWIKICDLPYAPASRQTMLAFICSSDKQPLIRESVASVAETSLLAYLYPDDSGKTFYAYGTYICQDS